MNTDEKILKVLEALQEGQQRLEGSYQRLEGNYQRLEGSYQRLEGNYQKLEGNYQKLEQGQKYLETGLAQHTTLLKALGAGFQDLREQVKTMSIDMATKKDVDITVEAAKHELKADIYLLNAKLTRKVQSHDRRIENLEKLEGVPNPDKH